MKRFVDTTLYSKEWFMELTPAEKCAWHYITAECDNVGVWAQNFKLAEFRIGEAIDWEDFRQKCNGNIVLTESGKWWLVDFCSFQYGELSEDSNSKPIISYIALLRKHGLWELFKGYPYPMDSVQDKDKDKDKGKDKEKDKELFLDNVLLERKEYDKLVSDYGDSVVESYIMRLDLYLENNPKKKPGGKNEYKDHNKTIRTWIRDDGIKKESDMSEVVI